MSEPSKSQLKKLEKERKKQEAKDARAAERAAKQGNAQKAQEGADGGGRGVLFGELPMIRSEKREGRVFSQVSDIGERIKEGDAVLFRGRVDSVRAAGNLCFIVLRQRVSSLQCVVCKGEGVSKEMVKFAQALHAESIIDIEGKLLKAEQSVEKCSVHDLELRVSKIFVVSAAADLPVQVSDCAVPPAVFAAQKAAMAEVQKRIDAVEEKKKATTDAEEIKKLDEQLAALAEEKAAVNRVVKVDRKTRLDNRVIDLRTRANNAIFRIQSAVGTLFREFLLTQDFVEIHSPKMLGAASEGGGASVFKLSYFKREACLAQSPQFYKQMAIAADFGRVFEVGPVFRAEQSFTRRHLCEFMGLDMEMSFYEHYYEVTDMIGKMFVYIFDELPKRFSKELQAIQDQYPFKPLRYQNPPLRFAWPDIVKMLRDAGENLGDFDDIGTEQETKLGQIIAEKYQSDFYWIDKYPSDIRPFYTMVDPADSRYSNSYDWFVRGWEIISGAQRIHEPEMLTQRAIYKNVPPDQIKEYIDAFRFGCPPHAGCGVGLERLVMLYLGLKNIRQSSLFPRDPKRLAP